MQKDVTSNKEIGRMSGYRSLFDFQEPDRLKAFSVRVTVGGAQLQSLLP